MCRRQEIRPGYRRYFNRGAGTIIAFSRRLYDVVVVLVRAG
jgi:hypothetical protein